MGKFKPHIFFLGIMFAYLTVRYLRARVADIPDFVRFYLTDLLFVPAMCLFALVIIRFLKRDSKLKISFPLVFTQVGIVALFFEWYLPYHSSKQDWYTSDLMDVLMYGLGGLLFLLLQRKL